jgi:hypothetical protein
MAKARITIEISKPKFSITFIPKTGRLVKTNGSSAQCNAHAKEVATPNASQLILKFILNK